MIWKRLDVSITSCCYLELLVKRHHRRLLASRTAAQHTIGSCTVAPTTNLVKVGYVNTNQIHLTHRRYGG